MTETKKRVFRRNAADQIELLSKIANADDAALDRLGDDPGSLLEAEALIIGCSLGVPCYKAIVRAQEIDKDVAFFYGSYSFIGTGAPTFKITVHRQGAETEKEDRSVYTG